MYQIKNHTINHHDSKILRTYIANNIYLPVVSPKLVYCSRLTCNKGKQTLRSILSTHHHDFSKQPKVAQQKQIYTTLYHVK